MLQRFQRMLRLKGGTSGVRFGRLRQGPRVRELGPGRVVPEHVHPHASCHSAPSPHESTRPVIDYGKLCRAHCSDHPRRWGQRGSVTARLASWPAQEASFKVFSLTRRRDCRFQLESCGTENSGQWPVRAGATGPAGVLGESGRWA